MATFKFGRAIDLHWNGYDIQGPAETVFSIPDQLYEEFDADIAPVEPTLVWIDTNEFQTLENSVVTSTIVSSAYITTASLTSGTQISIVSGSATDGYVLTADGAGGVAFEAAPGGAGALSSVIGTSPISVYQASGTATVSIDQSAITGATSATNTEVLRSYVKNSSGSTIAKGSVVYITGADGTNALIGLSSASTEATSSKTLGILASTLTNNAFGYVIKDGQLSNIDTSAASAGSSVWLGNTPGSYVFNAPPAEPSHSVYLGVVTKANVSTGEIVVKVQNGYELDELHDVSAGSPTDLDILQYKSSSSLWTKASIANAGIAASVHTHDYQASGTYVKAVIGTSPASVSTSSGTSTVSIVAGSINSTHLSATSVGSSQLIAQAVGTAALSSGAAANGTILTANGSGGATFASAPASGGYYVTGTSLVNGANLTSMATGPYLVGNPDSTSIEVISSDTVTSTVAQYQYVYSSQRTSTSTRFPVMSSWISSSLTTSTADPTGSRYINGEFWIFGTVSTAASAGLHRSSNSTSWTSVTTGLADGDIIKDIAYNGSNLYAFCGTNSSAGAGKVSTSPGTSGSTWTARTINANMLNALGIISSGSRWVVVGAGSASGETLTSTDGVTWASNTVGSNQLNSVAFGASTFVAVGEAGVIYTSPSTSGSTWTARTSGTAVRITQVTYANGIFAACTGSSVLSSSDGITWTSSSVGVAVRNIVYATFTNNGSRWVATGGSNIWAFSVNSPPSSWTTGTRGNLTSSGNGTCSISYNNNILLSAASMARYTRAVETTSFNSVWNPVTGVSA